MKFQKAKPVLFQFNTEETGNVEGKEFSSVRDFTKLLRKEFSKIGVDVVYYPSLKEMEFYSEEPKKGGRIHIFMNSSELPLTQVFDNPEDVKINIRDLGVKGTLKVALE